MSQNLSDYKRKMVTLHIPLRSEVEEILAEMKFIEIYTTNENLILQRRQEFQSNLDIQKTIVICRDLCREDGIDDKIELEENIIAEQNPFQHLYDNPNAKVNDYIRLATLHKLGIIAKGRENLMANEDLYNFMRMANEKQKRLYCFMLFIIFYHQIMFLFKYFLQDPLDAFALLLSTPVLWRNLKFYELDQVMRQANQQFPSILTKIGNGERLDETEISLIESRFYSVEEAATMCPQGI
ncbi:ATP-dependent DNA helicase [Trichonephila clavipes]|nr:ATP-dependent DNA helicase [Trichonephila clavipes]